MIKKGLITLATVLAAACAMAQDYTPLAPLRLGNDLLNLPTQQVLPRGMWEVRFTHRFAEPINEGDEDSLWGLDGSADIGIGLAWAPWRDLQFSVIRSDVQDNWEAAIKYALLKQAPSFPVSISARAGADIRTEDAIDQRTTEFAQLILSRQVNHRLELFAIPTYARHANSFDDAFNVPVGLAWMLKDTLALVVEIVPENGDLPDTVESDTAWTIGIKSTVGGHYFDVMISSSRATHVGQYVGSEFLPGVGVDSSDLHLGFNIVRRFGGR